MSDVTIWVPSETRDRLAFVAEAEGMSLRAWLDRLAETVRTPAERAEEAERTRQILLEWTGRDPAASDVDADAVLARRISETTSTRPNYSPFKPVTNNVNASALTVRP